MAVAYDNVSNTASASISEASFTLSHTPSGTPRAAMVWVITNGSATPYDTAVTYAGVSMTLVGYGIDDDTEPGCVRCYFLDNVSSGTQDVVVTRTNNATPMRAACITVTASGETEAYTSGRVTIGGSTENTGSDTTGSGVGAFAEVSVDDGSPGTDSLRLGCAFSGAANPPSAGANSTEATSLDWGAVGYTVVYETVPGQGSRSVGVTAGNDDRAAVFMAIREVPAPVQPYRGWYGTMGAW